MNAHTIREIPHAPGCKEGMGPSVVWEGRPFRSDVRLAFDCVSSSCIGQRVVLIEGATTPDQLCDMIRGLCVPLEVVA